MFSFPDPRTQDPAQRRRQRILEVIPGCLTWSVLLGMFFFSFFLPVWAALFVIAFDVYWICRTIFISTFVLVAYRRLREGQKIDWWERCQNIGDPESYQEKLLTYLRSLGSETKSFFVWRKVGIWREKKRIKRYIREVERIIQQKKQGLRILDWREIIHVVLLPTANEGAEVIEPALKAVAQSVFPKKQIIILLATEEREPAEKRQQKVAYLKEKFKDVFLDFLVTTHEVKEGELKCKASNATYAAKKLVEYLREKEIDFKKVILSNFDCDSVCHPQYLAALTYSYIIDPNRLQRAYQPLPLYNNNIWDTNAFVRVIVTSSSFWHLFQSTRSEMVTFSSHSEPFDTLVKVNFWPVNVISEDSIIYWKCFAYFHGDYKVSPIYLPISLDAVLASNYLKTIKNQYKQKRRWAYGIENFPLVMRAIWPDRKIGLKQKLRISVEMLEGHLSWATAPLLLALLGWLPLILGGDRFNESVLAHNLPFVTRFLMTVGMFGLIVSAFLGLTLLPSRPPHHSRKRYLYMLLQWFLAPLVAPVLGALPAIDSQTRILLGKYFGEFWVTEKVKIRN